ncbi:MAG TPA: hypothetical protein VJT83_07700 [Chitinophagaceae bacterium]|nr:hypothetical protein [Chitinophagaceae bacterium]
MQTDYQSNQHDSDRTLFKETNPPSVDVRAEEERKNIIARTRRNRREEGAKHWAFVSLIWLVVGCVGIAFLMKVCHILLPEDYYWLDEVHLRKIDEFLTTGILSGSVGIFFKSRIGNNQ